MEASIQEFTCQWKQAFRYFSVNGPNGSKPPASLSGDSKPPAMDPMDPTNSVFLSGDYVADPQIIEYPLFHVSFLSGDSKPPAANLLCPYLPYDWQTHEAIRFDYLPDLPEEEIRDLPTSAVVKACPRCAEVFQEGGENECDYMRCTACDLEFCRTCLSDRAIIEAHGNHYHTTTCKLWAAPPDPTRPVQYHMNCSTCCRTGAPCKPPSSEKAVPPLPLSDKDILEIYSCRIQRKNARGKAACATTDLKWNERGFGGSLGQHVFGGA